MEFGTESIKKYYIGVIFKLYNKIKLEDIFFNNQFLKEYNIPIEKFYDKKTLLKITKLIEKQEELSIEELNGKEFLD